MHVCPSEARERGGGSENALGRALGRRAGLAAHPELVVQAELQLRHSLRKREEQMGRAQVQHQGRRAGDLHGCGRQRDNSEGNHAWREISLRTDRKHFSRILPFTSLFSTAPVTYGARRVRKVPPLRRRGDS